MEICECWWRLQSGLERLLLNTKQKSADKQLRQILEFQRIFQELIDITIEVTSIFKLIFLSYIARNLWSGIVFGYITVRMFLVSEGIEFMYVVLAFVICIQPLLYSIVMNFIFCSMDFLIDTVKDILRQSFKHNAPVERTVSIRGIHSARK